MTVAANDRTTGFNTTAVVLLAVAAGILIWAFALFMQGGFLAAQAQEYAVKTFGPANEDVQGYRAEQRAILDEQARWLDQEQGTVILPIDDAKKAIVQKYGNE